MVLKIKILYVLAAMTLMWSCQPDTKTKTGTATQSEVTTTANTENINQANNNSTTSATDPNDNIGKPVIKNASNVQAKTQSSTTSTTNQGGNTVSAIDDPQLKEDLQAKLDQIERLEGTIPAADLEKKKRAIQQQLSSAVTKVDKVDPDALPSACSLITDKFLANVVDVDVRSIQLKDGSQRGQNTSRACFFKWDHNGNPNSGVLVQVQKNPLPEEIEQWAPYFIQAKLHQGDQDPQSGKTFKYKKFDMGVAGAYSYEMHRYLWRTDEERVFMIAFNLNASEKDELSWAQTIGEEVMKNYNRTRGK